MATLTDDGIPLSERNRLVLTVHNAMRADGNRLVTAVADPDRSDAQSAIVEPRYRN